MPRSKADKAKSILLSDHCLSREGLIEAAAVIQNGGEIEFPQDQIASLVETFDATGDRQNQKPDTFFPKAAVVLLAWVIAAVLILLYVNNVFAKALTAALLVITLGPTIAIWADLILPLFRICRSCKKRGVTQGSQKLFESSDPYDKWNSCQSCGAVYLRINGEWVPQPATTIDAEDYSRVDHAH